jgi:hypothetical protein
MKCWTFLLLILPVAGLVGCTGGSLAVEDRQERVLEGADPDAVLVAAAQILQREFGRAQIDRSNRRVITPPAEFTTDRESGTVRDVYRGKSTMRRKAEFSVGRRGEVTVARLRIDVERRDTERQIVMRPQGERLGDSPGQQSAIQADAATTGEQNAVWTRVRRDHKLERELLDELREQFARLAADREGTVSMPPPPPRPSGTKPAAGTNP